jgi:DNA-binding winged helix-turn-helix (wHTH) protein
MAGDFRGIAMTIRFGSFTLDPAGRRLLRGGQFVHLTPKAFELIQLLVTEAPRVVSKRELHERLWPGSFVSDATLVGLVKEARRALDDRDRGAPVIRTAHRVGYALCLEVEQAVPATRVWHWLVVEGRRVVLRQGENIVGRDPASQVFLDAAGISRRHARIVVDERSVQLEDLGSKNGTTLNGAGVEGVVVLRDGDRTAFGAIAGVYRVSSAGMSTETRSRGARASTSSARR